MIRRFILSAVIAAMPFAASAQEKTVPTSRPQAVLSFAPVVKQVAPAVVNIYTKKVVQQRVNPLFDDPFFRRFFGDQGIPGMSREQVQNSLGSGVIVRATGVVVTNNHVVGDADEIRVVLNDKREYAAKVLGKDDRSDLAVLQLQGVKENLPALDLSDSDNIEVGDMVLAIGNPFGVGQTVTSGIVSALGRSSVELAGYRSFIQTDAAINPGNSGGPLITSDGRLIGVNTAIYSQSGGSIGIGFAIPSNMARTVLASILKQGKVVHAWFGATGKTVTADLAKNLGLPRPQGVVITRVAANSPAARAGIKSGDVVRKVNGHAAGEVEELQYLLASMPIGTTTTLDITRDGVEQSVRMTLEGPPEIPARTPTILQGHQPLQGVTVANLNPAFAEELGRSYNEPEVVITKISPNTYAAQVGTQPGDVILAVNKTDIKTVQDLVDALKVPVESWTITLNRGGQTLQFTVGG